MARVLQRVCVFCGSSMGFDGSYRVAAEATGKALVERGCELVYGGGSVGLMGVVADAVMAAGGNVTGVIPEKLATKELLHVGVRDMHVVPTMHDRKALMASLSDAFIALPGGYGTLEELFEVVTWAQLGIHAKPVGILNVNGYYDGLLEFIDRAISAGFMKAEHRRLFVADNEVHTLLARLAEHEMPELRKWIDVSQS